jgi:glycosyltransferase involved in cell wall biosynthesis
MPQIAIIDPALGRTGAHNRGFATLLVRQGASRGELGVWCNRSIDTHLSKELADCGATVDPAFDIDFYQLMEKSTGGVAEHWDWVYGLACQYARVFQQVLRRWPRGTVYLVHHTLSWEHASALALAMGLAGGASGRLRHLALLMFSPGVDCAGEIYDSERALNFRLAFRALDRAPGVSLYAGCSEYARAYATLLERPELLPVHPCFLGDWRIKPPSRRGSSSRTILLYVGEIKQQKGFLQLPRMLERLLRTTTVDTRIVIQFVAVRNGTAKRVVDELTRLAEGNERVELHHGFWSDEQLREVLSSADVLCLNYDVDAYQHATSGLLWLAAWHGLAVQVPSDCWLQREALRLGVPVYRSLDATGGVTSAVGTVPRDENYFNTLFMPFWDWLKANTAEHSAPRDALGGGRGADIVLFWKQNDTGLYGRRSDMIVRYLASRPDVRRVLVVDAPIGDTNLKRLARDTPTPTQNQKIHAEIQQKLQGARDIGKVSHHVYVCPLDAYRFRDDGSSRPHFIEGYIRYLAEVFSEQGIDPRRALFWIYPTNTHAPQLIRHFQPARVVADVEDDQREWPGVSEASRDRLTSNYRDILGASDAVMTNCEPLRERMAGFFKDIRLVPNGCDVDPPHTVPANNAAFDEFIGFPGKTIGFVGNLESKIDTALLQKVAERFHDSQVVLLGSTHANPDVFALSRNPNVRMPGVVPYPELDAWLQKFDVGLVPHRITGLTQSMNPQKIYAYLSSGVPVVSTDISNIPRDTELVKIAASHEQFLDEVAAALQRGRPRAATFHAYVTENSWAQRLRAFTDGLDLGRISG